MLSLWESATGVVAPSVTEQLSTHAPWTSARYVSVRVTADDEIVVLCQHDHVPLSFRKVILDGTGLEEVTCRGSTVRVTPHGGQAPD
jgi:hypothetical protein